MGVTLSDSPEWDARTNFLQSERERAHAFALGWSIGRGALIDVDAFAVLYLGKARATMDGGRPYGPVHMEFLEWIKSNV